MYDQCHENKILGLLLCYIKTSLNQLSVYLMFGLVPPPVKYLVEFGLEMVQIVLKDKKNKNST